MRNAAALALVGWYLVVPPSVSKLSSERSMAALSHWTIIREFDAEKECDAARVESSKGDSTQGEYRGMPAEEIYDAQCIATDDPRLNSD